MKKKLAVFVLAVAGLAVMAQTCVIKNLTITEINGKAVVSAEIENQTDADVLNHRFVVAFLDNNLDVIDTRTVEGCLRSLQSGESNFFSAFSNENFEDVEVSLQRLLGPLTFGEVADDGGLDIKNVTITRTDNDIVVNANIENTGTDDLQDVRLCAVIVDNDDKILVTKRSSAQDIDEDATKNFTITLDTPDDAGEVFEADLFADGVNPSEDDKPTKPVSEVDQDIDECPNPTNTATPITQTPTPSNTPTPTGTPPTATNTPVPDAC